MKPGFEPGIAREMTAVVTEEMCPAFERVIVHRVYSTWSAAHHFELTARKVLVDFLDPDEEGIGARLLIDHVAPCPVGRTVRVRAELREVIRSRSGIRVICDVTAHDGERLLARGEQTQVVKNKEELKRYIERS